MIKKEKPEKPESFSEKVLTSYFIKWYNKLMLWPLKRGYSHSIYTYSTTIRQKIKGSYQDFYNFAGRICR